MVSVVWVPKADMELTEALARYERIRPSPACVLAVTHTVEQIASGRLHYAVVKNERRRAGVHRFP